MESFMQTDQTKGEIITIWQNPSSTPLRLGLLVARSFRLH